MADKPRLASGRSARWAFMEKFEVPYFDKPEINYLTRWRLVQTPWFGFYLHRFDAPDSRPTLHDHPWPFLSIMLRGGYVERRLDPQTLEVDEHHTVRHLNWMPAFGAHSIMRLLRTPTWSLVLVGRRARIWGYVEPYVMEQDQGLMLWQRFDRHPHAAEFDAALAMRREAPHD